MTYIYFAYGSNMNEHQMLERCPSGRLLGVASIDDYKLAFNIYSPKRQCGCADIIFDKNNKVFGLLYELTIADIKKLDEFEGVSQKAYERIQLPVSFASRKLIAETYQVLNKKDFIAPSKEYINLIISAATKHGFPEEYIKILKSVETIN